MRAVTVKSGPPIFVGHYEVHSVESGWNGTSQYRNKATGATLQCNAGLWTLVGYDKGQKMQYSSKYYGNRRVPWEHFQIHSAQWRLDAGEHHGSPLEFEGMHACTL